MATNTVVTVTDDLDGSTNAETVEFEYGGTRYAIDLGRKNASAMDKALKPYIDAARTVKSSKPATRGRSKAKSSASGHDLSEIRSWAQANGYEVSTRGRISGAVVEAYEAAQG